MGGSGMCGDEGGVGRGMAGRWGIDGTLFQKPELIMGTVPQIGATLTVYKGNNKLYKYKYSVCVV